MGECTRPWVGYPMPHKTGYGGWHMPISPQSSLVTWQTPGQHQTRDPISPYHLPKRIFKNFWIGFMDFMLKSTGPKHISWSPNRKEHTGSLEAEIWVLTISHCLQLHTFGWAMWPPHHYSYCNQVEWCVQLTGWTMERRWDGWTTWHNAWRSAT